MLLLFVFKASYLVIGISLVVFCILAEFFARYFDGGVNKHHPDLTGKIIIVTGANSGLGEASVSEMYKLNPKKIIMACRTEAKAKASINKILGMNKNVEKV